MSFSIVWLKINHENVKCQSKGKILTMIKRVSITENSVYSSEMCAKTSWPSCLFERERERERDKRPVEMIMFILFAATKVMGKVFYIIRRITTEISLLMLFSKRFFKHTLI